VHEAREDHAERVARIVHEVIEEPIEIATSGRSLWPSFPLETKIDERWS
jgi:hypothetical protein